MSKKINFEKCRTWQGANYPPPFDAPCMARRWLALGDAAGLTQFGVKLMTLQPGAWSSQRHWHAREDEFIWVVQGPVVLVTDGGEEILQSGECAGFVAGEADGHHFINRGEADVVLLAVGTRHAEDFVQYSDIDLRTLPGPKGGYANKKGEPL